MKENRSKVGRLCARKYRSLSRAHKIVSLAFIVVTLVAVIIALPWVREAFIAKVRSVNASWYDAGWPARILRITLGFLPTMVLLTGIVIGAGAAIARLFVTKRIFVVLVALLAFKELILLFGIMDDYSIITWFKFAAAAVNPFSYLNWLSLLLPVASIALFFRRRLLAGVVVDLIFSFLLMANLWYFRAFGELLSREALLAIGELGRLGATSFSLSKPVDILFYIDIPFLLFFAVRAWKRPGLRHPIAAGACIVASILAVAFIPKSPLVSSPVLFYASNSPIYKHVYSEIWNRRLRNPLTLQERDEIGSWIRSRRESSNAYSGLFAKKNLLFISVESLESFPVGRTYRGQPLTPSINALLPHAYFFPNMYEQVGGGTSNDGFLMYNTGLYPLKNGAVSYRFPSAKFRSLTDFFKAKGYFTAELSANWPNAWNQRPMLRSMGFDKEMHVGMGFEKATTPDEAHRFGIDDAYFFKQLLPVVKEAKKPYFIYIVTLSSHQPFGETPNKRLLNYGGKESELADYTQSIRWTDEHLGKFLTGLDQKDLLDDTVVVVTGDHAGLSKYYPGSYEEAKDFSPPRDVKFDGENKRVPFILFSKDIKNPQTIQTIGGQVDGYSTLIDLFSDDRAEADKYVSFGKSLFNVKKGDPGYAVTIYGGTKGAFANEAERENLLKGPAYSERIITAGESNLKFVP